MSPTKRRGGSEKRGGGENGLNRLGFGNEGGTNSLKLSKDVATPAAPVEYKDDFKLPEPEPETLGFKDPRDERIFLLNLDRLSDDTYLPAIQNKKRKLANLKQLIDETDVLAKKGNATARAKLASLLTKLRFTEVIEISDEYKKLIERALAQ